MADEKKVNERVNEMNIKPIDEKIEESGKALEELLEVLTKLKETGVLGLLKSLVDNYEDLMIFLAQDRRIYKALSLVEGALDGIEEAHAAKLKYATMNLSQCASKAMEELMGTEEVQPLGLLGLLRMLRDPDVAFGLGVVMLMLKTIGKCFRSNMEKWKE